eukprot:CAMPEP_0113934792 /NCGR_PEP_ID=MMETSP1339-20121228/2062_1 /TAXON_ID=94617 /ORGANISM="Fibrocapsa japonica" /LENGTH=295 /DNA_ID=CAMNT_0000936727 /DNA_START=486 /DNA_END=1373 /DNA_ORIENTATION=+ /assembly_acc=CAM_ASM_000762
MESSGSRKAVGRDHSGSDDFTTGGLGTGPVSLDIECYAGGNSVSTNSPSKRVVNRPKECFPAGGPGGEGVHITSPANPDAGASAESCDAEEAPSGTVNGSCASTSSLGTVNLSRARSSSLSIAMNPPHISRQDSKSTGPKKTKQARDTMDPCETLAWTTILGGLMLLPLVVIFEGPWLATMEWQEGAKLTNFLGTVIASALGLYTYEECAFLFLNATSPVTQTIGNAMRRVFLVGISIFWFATPVTTFSVIGSMVAIAGVGLYSVLRSQVQPNQNKNGAADESGVSIELNKWHVR